MNLLKAIIFSFAFYRIKPNWNVVVNETPCTCGLKCVMDLGHVFLTNFCEGLNLSIHNPLARQMFEYFKSCE